MVHAFPPELFHFLNQLTRNNNRKWFQKNKTRYETEVLEPSLEFIRIFHSRLQRISPHFLASDKRIGGSLMRIYRDTRFSKDKSPYKTNVGIQFRHESGKDVHAPGFYVHIQPDECFLGAGLWHPDSQSLKKIREQIDTDRTAWKRCRDNRKFRDQFDLAGDSLKTSPRDYPADHPLIEDLKRKDFICVRHLTESDVLSADFVQMVAASFQASRPFVRFLCKALHLPF